MYQETTTWESRTYEYHNKYVRNYRAIGVLWAILTVCFVIINIVVFVQPQWIGDTGSIDAAGYGHFGLYRHCALRSNEALVCSGGIDNWDTILSPAFKAATAFIGLSALFILLCICCFLLFFFLRAYYVFYICGTIQALSVLCMFLGCVIYPAGWDHLIVYNVCKGGLYNAGVCQIRWAFILAIIGIFDILFLCILAFVLALKYPKALPTYYKSETMTKSEMNGYHYDTASDKKSNMAINPVMMMPPPPHEADRYSEYSHRSDPARSRRLDPHHKGRSDFQL
ncbi:LHFPL tetraspan subfamily member 3 protein isoform X1 [Lingula anatina]|uniref:LHFPL tetraspan subfamily member 3 protein isoform X1 n=1 Tax=Lingula anatina TaxID=7574 RepID=A0A1S3JNJ3_LINAN|nr:LHFPL tetraspan subfamily member 3 protein isoform X1 [Lingula anatina]|eukprot:XP_013411938.1 LHFPL tetraspan subfamily member 3 protein isoform X1 [Lingula anatina]